MYQGKFDAKSRGQNAPEEALQSILAARNEAIAEKEARAKRRAEAKEAAKPNEPVPAEPKRPAAKKPAARKPVELEEDVQDVAVKAPKAKAGKSKKKGPRTGTVVFYTLYFLMIFAFALGTVGALVWLNGWLQDYEAAQPTVKCQEVFDELFSNPDWAKLYQMAGVQDTPYEGVDQYVEYMTEKVGGQKLSFVETSAGLMKGKKYIVRLGNEKIATFLLTGEGEGITGIPDWKLGDVELFFSRQQGYLIQKLDGHQSYVNGVPLSEDFTIQIGTTKADEFLPIGVTGVRTTVQKIDGLMAKPTVTVFTQTGEEMPVDYDESTGTFVEQTTATTITAEEREVVVGAMKAYAEFMINAAGSRAAVAKYYDGSSQTYKDILKMQSELWMNADNGHSFDEPEINGYTKYNDELFSVHGKITMHTTLKDNTTRDYTIDQSYFFSQKNGKWVCYETTNEDISLPVGKVRLTFHDENGTALKSEFYDTEASSLVAPVLAAPSGKVFTGWVTESVDDSGKKTLSLVFTPDENGKVTLSAGTSLVPMELYPLFENAE